jgi:hypothetical protein
MMLDIHLESDYPVFKDLELRRFSSSALVLYHGIRSRAEEQREAGNYG